MRLPILGFLLGVRKVGSSGKGEAVENPAVSLLVRTGSAGDKPDLLLLSMRQPGLASGTRLSPPRPEPGLERPPGRS
jgi:hypothetical protein